MKGTRLEALFSGRWDKKLSRDGHGRIFLDVDPTCFQAIVDYLSEMIEHHSMAILTSEEILQKTHSERVKKLAENIITTQEKEIDYMKQML